MTNSTNNNDTWFVVGVGLVMAAMVAGVIFWLQSTLPVGRAVRITTEPTLSKKSATTAAQATTPAEIASAPTIEPTSTPAGAVAAPAEAPAEVVAAIIKGGCIACHTIPSVPNAVGQVGSNLTNIGNDGATRKDGLTAEAYIRESILEPGVFTAPECPTGPCPAGVMPPIQLAEAEVEAIVGYLAGLKVVETTAEAPAATPTPAVQPTLPAEPVALAPAQAEPSAPSEIVAAFNKGGCVGYHTITGIPGANGQVGPNLAEIGATAATRKTGLSAEEYIRESIVDPNAFIAPECPGGSCPEGVMLQTFAQSLSSADLDTIVGYLTLLGTDQAMTLTVASAETTSVALDGSRPTESVLAPFKVLPKEPAKDTLVALGKYLFFDNRLSGNNSLSCASCHQPDKAFSDGQPLSQGYPSTQYFRNTPSLYNTVFSSYLYWDGRMDGSDLPIYLLEKHFVGSSLKTLLGVKWFCVTL